MNLLNIRINRNQKKAAIIIAIVILSLIFFSLGLIFPPHFSPPTEVNINPGQGVSSIARSLKDAGVIRSTLAFKSYVALSGQGDELKAGKYIFEGGSMFSAANRIAKGESIPDDLSVVIFEGMNVWDIDRRLTDLRLIKAGEFSGRAYVYEGYLFPDTYRISKDLTGVALAENLIFRMRSRFDSVVTPVLTNVSDREDVIVKASIIEKEARLQSDMKLIAGIIENRIERKMLFQIDATVAYGYCLKMGVDKACDVTQTNLVREIKSDGPYNTYTREGLPAGPISNPGLVSIMAVLKPTESNFLYYLSTRDGSQIIYSRTGEEHTANRRRYLGI